MNDEDFYKSLAGEITDESKDSELDAENIAKSLQGMDDLEADLFGKSMKNNLGKNKRKNSVEESKRDKDITDTGLNEKNNKAPATKKQFDFGEFDEDDPLAGLLSDEDEQETSNVLDNKNEKVEMLSSSKEHKENKIERNFIEETSLKPKSNASFSKAVASKDIDFGNDKDVLGSLGLDDSPKNDRKDLSHLFSTDSNNTDKHLNNTSKNLKSTFLDSLLNKEVSTESSTKHSSDDFLFGSYQPSIGTASHGRRNERKNTSLQMNNTGNNPPKKLDSFDFTLLDKNTKDLQTKDDKPTNDVGTPKHISSNKISSDDWLSEKLNDIPKDTKFIGKDEVQNGANEDKIKLNKKDELHDWLGLKDNTNSRDLTPVRERSHRRPHGISWLESEDSAFHSQATSTPLPAKLSPEESFPKDDMKLKQKPKSGVIFGDEVKKLTEKKSIIDTSSLANTEDILLTKTKSSTEKYLDDTSITISDNKTSGAFEVDLPENTRDTGLEYKRTDKVSSMTVDTQYIDISEKMKSRLPRTDYTPNALNQLQNKVELMEKEHSHLMSYLQSLQGNHQQQLTALIEAHQSQIKHLEQENRNLEIKNIREQEMMQKEYESKTDKWNKEWKETMTSHHNKLEDVQKYLLTEVADLKKRETIAFKELRTFFEESFETFKKYLSRNNEESFISGNSSLNALMQNCLALLKQQADEFTLLKKQLEEEKRTNLKEREAKLHEQEIKLLKQATNIQSNPLPNQQLNEYERRIKEQSAELAKEWEKLENSRQKFFEDQELKKQELKQEIEDYINSQFLKQQEYLYNWQLRLEENAQALEVKEKAILLKLNVNELQNVESSDREELPAGSRMENIKEQKLLNWQAKLENETRKLDELNATLIMKKKDLEEEQNALHNLAEQVKHRSVEAENMCMIASKIREEGLVALDLAKKKENEQESILTSVQKQLQVLRNKEEFLNKEKFSLLNQMNASYSYCVCRKCMSMMVNKKPGYIQEFAAHQDLPEIDDKKFPTSSMNDFHKDTFLNQNLNILPTANQQIWTNEHVHKLESSTSKEEKNLINSLDPSIVSWQMLADQDRKILENEKMYLLSLLQSGS